MNEMANISQMKNNFKEKYVQTKLYYELFQNAQDLTCDANISLLGLSDSIMSLLNDSEYAKRIRNKLFKSEHYTIDNPIYLVKTQLYWEKRILKSLNTMCNELNIPLARKRPAQEIQEMKRAWNELGTNVSDLSKFRPVYAPKDFLEVVLGIKNTNLTDFTSQFITGLIQIPLSVKNLAEIKKEFAELTLEFTHNGLIDNLNSPMDNERIKIGHKVIEIGDLLLARQYSKQGCAISQRRKLWSLMLNVEVDELDVFYYNYLKQCVLEYDLLVDSLYYKDVKLTAVNDDQLFVFEDFLYQVLLLFSRDTHVLKCFQSNGANPPKSFIKGHTSDKYVVTYPPNGVIPFHGFSMLVAPICYVYNDPVLLYYMFREFYMTHLHKLNIISSDPQGILSLCYLFETLLQAKDPELFLHLRRIQAQPLRIAFKWIMRAFSGFLASSQLLELWDRILAFNSLEVLSICAVGVFLYRKQNIMLVNNDVNVEAIFADLTSLKVVPILQLVLL